MLGSTGSIGTQTLDIIAEFPDKFELVALSAGGNIELLAKQVMTVWARETSGGLRRCCAPEAGTWCQRAHAPQQRPPSHALLFAHAFWACPGSATHANKAMLPSSEFARAPANAGEPPATRSSVESAVVAAARVLR